MTTPAPTAADIANAERPVDEELWERRMKVLTMRNAGATYQRIADQLGISTVTARKDLQRAYREVLNDTPEDMLARQRSVLLDITRANYPAALNGDKDAAMTIIKGLEQEAKLFGLYAPTRALIGVSDVEFAEQAAALIASINAIDPTALNELEATNAHNQTRRGHVIDGEAVEVGAEDRPDDSGDAGDGHGAGDAAPAASGDEVPERDTASTDGGDDDDWSNL